MLFNLESYYKRVTGGSIINFSVLDEVVIFYLRCLYLRWTVFKKGVTSYLLRDTYLRALDKSIRPGDINACTFQFLDA